MRGDWNKSRTYVYVSELMEQQPYFPSRIPTPHSTSGTFCITHALKLTVRHPETLLTTMIPQNRVEQHHQQQDDETNHPSYSLRKRMIVRLNAYCLPRWGVRRRLPDTYAVLRTRLENQAVEDEPLDRPLQLQRQQSHQGHNNGQAIQHRKTEM